MMDYLVSREELRNMLASGNIISVSNFNVAATDAGEM